MRNHDRGIAPSCYPLGRRRRSFAFPGQRGSLFGRWRRSGDLRCLSLSGDPLQIQLPAARRGSSPPAPAAVMTRPLPLRRPPRDLSLFEDPLWTLPLRTGGAPATPRHLPCSGDPFRTLPLWLPVARRGPSPCRGGGHGLAAAPPSPATPAAPPSPATPATLPSPAARLLLRSDGSAAPSWRFVFGFPSSELRGAAGPSS